MYCNNRCLENKDICDLKIDCNSIPPEDEFESQCSKRYNDELDSLSLM